MSHQAKSPLKLSAAPQARIASVMDDYHGRQISDPYRWLEDSTSEETRLFVEEQNAYTRSVLENVPGRDELRVRIEQLLTIGRVGSPRVCGNRYFYERRDGRQNQAIVYVRDSGVGQGLQNSDRVLINVNTLAPDGTIALDWWYPSEDGSYVAYGTSANGSELSTLQVIEVSTGRLLPEKIERTRAASMAWLPGSSGFYYTRYPRPGDVPAGEEMSHRRVLFHALGGSQSDGGGDPLIFPADGYTIDPQHWPNVTISNDGRWLVVAVRGGW